jgi:chalcone isomerase
MGTEASDCGSFAVAGMELEGTVFPSTLNPPRSRKPLFLGGAGIRGYDVNGKFKIFTVSGVYLESEAVNFLAKRWRGKSVEELSSSNQFFDDIITGPFDRASQITLVAPLDGKEFARLVVKSCTEILKKNGLYSQKEEKECEELKKFFEPINLPPGSTVFFTYCTSGHLMVTVSDDTSVPEVENLAIDCRNLMEALLASIIGENGVSPAAKLSLASRMHDIMNR